MTYRMCLSLLDLHGNCNAMLEELKFPVLTRLMHRQKFSKIIIAYWKFNFQNFVYKELVWNQILNCYFKMWHSYSYLKEKAQTRWLCLKEHFCFFKKISSADFSWFLGYVRVASFPQIPHMNINKRTECTGEVVFVFFFCPMGWMLTVLGICYSWEGGVPTHGIIFRWLITFRRSQKALEAHLQLWLSFSHYSHW